MVRTERAVSCALTAPHSPLDYSAELTGKLLGRPALAGKVFLAALVDVLADLGVLELEVVTSRAVSRPLSTTRAAAVVQPMPAELAGTVGPSLASWRSGTEDVPSPLRTIPRGAGKSIGEGEECEAESSEDTENASHENAAILEKKPHEAQPWNVSRPVGKIDQRQRGPGKNKANSESQPRRFDLGEQ